MRTLLVLLSLTVAFAAEWSKGYSVRSSPNLDVRCDDASVELISAGTGRIEAKLVTRGWDIRPGEVEVVESQTGDRVNIQIKMPKWRFGWKADRSARLYVSVPQQLTARIATGDGSIRANNVSGDIRLSTGDGSISASGLGGSLEAHTGDGSIRVDGRFDVLRVNTGDGSVGVTAAPGSMVKSGWSIETGDGSVTVRVPSDLRADLDAKTGDGRLSVSLPGFQASGSSEHHVSGRIGGGGLPFKLRTGDGSVTIATSH